MPGKRTRIRVGKGKGKYVYALRDKKGRFVDIQSIPRTIRADMPKKARIRKWVGYGYMIDLPKRRKHKKRRR